MPVSGIRDIEKWVAKYKYRLLMELIQYQIYLYLKLMHKDYAVLASVLAVFTATLAAG